LQDEVNQEDSEQNEVDGRRTRRSWFHRQGDAYLKERLVICNEEDTDDRTTRVTSNSGPRTGLDYSKIS